MKLEPTNIRYLTSEEFRVLTAVSSLATWPLFLFSSSSSSSSFLPFFLFQTMKNSPHSQVETGSRNHEIVPLNLICNIAGLRGGGTKKVLSLLQRKGLVNKVPDSKCWTFFIFFLFSSIFLIKSFLLWVIGHERRGLQINLWRIWFSCLKDLCEERHSLFCGKSDRCGQRIRFSSIIVIII